MVQNSLGEQVNTLGSGDELSGAGGLDTLNAKVASGVFAGGSVTMPIQPEMSGIETINLEAVISDIASNQSNDIENNDVVYVNAKDITDIENLSSVYSDASLVVQNVTTLKSNGLSGNTADITVGMKYTGNADSHWDESDLAVYFDQDYLLRGQTEEGGFFYDILNQKAYDINTGAPVLGFPLKAIGFSIQVNDATGSVEYSLPITSLDMATISTHTELAVLLNAKLATTYPTLTGLSFSVVGTFNDGDGRTSERVQLTDSESAGRTITEGYITLDEKSPSGNLYWDRGSLDDVKTDTLVTVGVALEKVGLAGDGGDLIIGSMNKTADNEWGGVSTVTDTVSGVEQFNVTVYGANDKSSSLASMQSTNNNLRVVNVITDEAQTGASFADLTIGNINTDGSALKDVQIFNASTFKGNLTLDADLTNDVAAKYLNLVDQAPNEPAADNVAFQYTGGLGNDTINVDIDTSNFDAVGSATREDFTLNIAGGEGDDTLSLYLEDSVFLNEVRPGNPNFDNWYDNEAMLANLSINGGAGDDTIMTPGSGDVIIDAGTGDDTVYADNIGSKAVWAFNVENAIPGADSVRYQLNNLQSDANDSYKLYNGKLTVDFKGFESLAVTIPSSSGITSDLQINQAIKLAINSDDVLSKLLVATDGPANTLVVKSLIDGTQVVTDLSVSIAAPTTLTASEVSQLNGWYASTGVSAATLIADMGAVVAGFDLEADYGSNFAKSGTDMVGSDSVATSDNTITGALGDDVLVLGTGMYSNDTVVYEGFGNGTDSIVNFDTTWNAGGVVTYPSVSAVAEKVTLTFSASDGSPAAQNIIFNDGTNSVTAILSAPSVAGVIPAADVANQFADQFALAGWSMTPHVAGETTVTLTRTTAGVYTDITAASLTGTYFGAANGNGVVTVATTVQGANAINSGTQSTFAVTFDTTDTAAVAAGTFVFDGVTVAYAAGDGSYTLANKLDAASFTNWNTAVTEVSGDFVVTFTAKAPGDTAIGTDAAFKVDGATPVDGIIGALTGTVGNANGGVAGTVAVPTVSVASPGDGLDYLDFSSYDAVAVYVDGALIKGAAPVLTQEYVTLVESATNLGEYTMKVWTEAGALGAAGDVEVGTIGVADFGATQNFVSANFIL